MEPSTYAFDAHHLVKDPSTGNLFPPFPLSLRESGGSYKGGFSVTSSSHLRHKHPYNPVHSFLSAEGIHLDDASTVDAGDLPRRYDPNEVKARFTWFGALCLAGIGMFIEAYMIITTGQVKTVWIDQYPACWAPQTDQHCPSKIECCGLFPNTPELSNGTCIPTHPSACTSDGEFPDSQLCPEALLNSISYSEFAGIMLGMITFGKVADVMGKVRAGILTSLLMVLGVTFMSFFASDDASTLFLVFSIMYGLFGFGVGGEYPMTAMLAASHHAQSTQDALEDDEDQKRHRVMLNKAQTARRGETISLVFAMQGVGAVVGSAYLLFLIYFANQTRTVCDDDAYGRNASGYDVDALNGVWRAFYLIGGTFIFLIVLYRTLIEEEGTARQTLEERKERRKISGRKELSTWQVLRFYGPRLIGTGGNWFLLDVAFYGLKLYSGPIFEDLSPGGDLIVKNGYLLVYNIIGLIGYYVAAYYMDRPSIGRKRLQMASFAILTVLFCLSAALFETASPQILMTLYFLSNFFSTFGANTTTYVMAAETYPTELRGTCHGLSAFSGKLGALLATIAFGVVNSQTIFWICGGVSAVGVLVTYAFSCDMTGLSLAEHDAQLELLMDDRLSEYKGQLNAPEHLSNYELWTGRHGEYDPDWARNYVRRQKKQEEAALVTSSVHLKTLHTDTIKELNHPVDGEEGDDADHGEN
jgi:MFS family permease